MKNIYKDLNINTNEIIFLETNNKSTLSNTAKKQLSKKIKMEFFHLNMSKTYIVEIFKQNTFRRLINILKDKYPELKESNFDEIFIEEDESTKKYIVKNEKDLDKKIEEILKIGDEDNDNIFYIEGDIIDSFDLQLCHVTQNYHKYTIKAGKKELFHNAIYKFTKKDDDIFKDKIITKIYSLKEQILSINIKRVTSISKIHIEPDA